MSEILEIDLPMSTFEKNCLIHDVLGVGFGPSNLAFAIAHEEADSQLDVRFLEQADGPNWQPGMLLDGSDIQNNPLRDLVTPRNPKSHYTFINYLKSEGRLYDYLNLGILYPLRKDYAKYITWAAQFFSERVTYGTRVSSVEYDRDLHCWTARSDKDRFLARSLLVGTGRSRNVPEVFAPHLGGRVFHLCDYRPAMKALAPGLHSIAVVGSSQSAVEIHLDLLASYPHAHIHAIHRGYAMRQKDTSPFSDHVYFPEFIDYFFSVSDTSRLELERQLRPTNYGTADIDVLHKLYLTLYEERLEGRNRFRISNNTEVVSVRPSADGVALELRERFLDRTSELYVDAVVLATGFKDLGSGEGKEHFPALLAGVADGLGRRADGALCVERDYSVASESGLRIYLNGLCESSHGLGDAGSFSLLSLRSSEILASMERDVAGFASRALRRASA
ncbi:lysine N(6)-hydroxylase/L-ornithine N(5)-oxygenase family protein [Methylobacterium sp. SyP6R]|uniref:lysine N(6)-hydroxylase/L-ornithine N(5)-oxygenase family protein n=1 Tax=Methylobacterium sp. SyP6R TaxID=2718876 RepID=UPI001F158052|nr:SidA/IucD/PvdA family monooxygenase [Methylobacterium sp. SyP6R]MCF4130070.1 SidA/IucD/PvdA family monooxygenase [Methylobacterium sp. SyP6R]